MPEVTDKMEQAAWNAWRNGSMRAAIEAALAARERVNVKEHVKKFVHIRPVVMEGSPDAHNVFLQVTNQSFCITQYGCENREDAEWMQEMLCVALAKIIHDWKTNDNTSS